MTAEISCFTYEQIYYTLWELSQRYSQVTQFRVIGKSHDERMIPMLELGFGREPIFCIGGLNGTDRYMPSCLLKMAEEYCRAWECGWTLGEFYQIKELLEQWKLCFIPILNPDGYEIYEKDYAVIRNPIYRQMLRMQETPCKEYFCNARGMNLCKNFPTSYYRKKRVGHEPASENETKALIRIFQEYQGRGLLSFGIADKRIVYFRQPQSYAVNQRCSRFARHFQKESGFRPERFNLNLSGAQNEMPGEGSPERFFAEIMRQPSFRIELPAGKTTDTPDIDSYQQIYTIPLEYLFSMSAE